MTHANLVSILTHTARYGHINIGAIRTVEDIHTAKRFSSHFRAAVHDLDDSMVLRAVTAVQAKGERKFRRGCGQWLTDKEAAK